MRQAETTHRTTIDIETSAFEEARDVLGTNGYKETINQALRTVSQTDRLRRGATLIRSGELDLITPEELEEKRRPRV